ncbi:hypothetical protein AVEN_148282-1 [Araneus ventricosus]|uniref:Uncharacterized protein n=1 Tax=Araneus ventricosus TaxID=182803 RepID=A0A4Y2WCJ0_ARAVE|nr:hypothetical protein AVEN_208876-1 [Araneus ventricosus]GBO35410.1 hypothetical protein AVEN_148282-1 [Araneus ventricosus]
MKIPKAKGFEKRPNFPFGLKKANMIIWPDLVACPVVSKHSFGTPKYPVLRRRATCDNNSKQEEDKKLKSNTVISSRPPMTEHALYVSHLCYWSEACYLALGSNFTV